MRKSHFWLACSKYKGFPKSLYKMSLARKNRSLSISARRESSTFILQYIVVLISTTEPENMSPQLRLGVKLSPVLVFGSQNCVQPTIPIVNLIGNTIEIHVFSLYFPLGNEEKNNFHSEIFSIVKFEQYTIYEVPRSKFLLESEQPNMVCSRDSPCRKWIESVTMHVEL